MTDPTKCERCGQVDCPTLAWTRAHQTARPHVDVEWTAAFDACAAMGTKRSLDQIGDILAALEMNTRPR